MLYNKAINFAPCGRLTLVARAVYGETLGTDKNTR